MNRDGNGSSPFLKWAGGKRWLAPAIAALAQTTNFRRYFEPFVGGGAVYFALKPPIAFLADINSDLINAYKEVKRRPLVLAAQLGKLSINPTQYATVRSSRPISRVARAVRFLYLNRTAFNGLYRVNQQGNFNVPYGCKVTTRLPDEHLLRSASRALRNATFTAGSFAQTLRAVRRSDFVYIDPPYTVKHDQNGFRRYNESLFTWSDQEALANTAAELTRRGAYVTISNAHHTDLRHLYCACHFTAFRVSRASNMASAAFDRGRAHELLVVSRTISTNARVRDILADHVSVRREHLFARCELA